MKNTKQKCLMKDFIHMLFSYFKEFKFNSFMGIGVNN